MSLWRTRTTAPIGTPTSDALAGPVHACVVVSLHQNSVAYPTSRRLTHKVVATTHKRVQPHNMINESIPAERRRLESSAAERLHRVRWPLEGKTVTM
jgi:hypothetical protein